MREPADCALGGVIVLSGGSMNEVELPPATGRPKMRVLVAHGGADRLIPIGKGEATARHFATCVRLQSCTLTLIPALARGLHRRARQRRRRAVHWPW